MAGLAVWEWLALALAAMTVGFAKTAIGGAGSVSVAVFAAILPARQSTGILLPLLICGDIMAVAVYRRHANWPLLLRLLPWVGVGLLTGFGFVAVADDRVMRRTIGLVVLVLVVLQLLRRGRGGGYLDRLRPTSPTTPVSPGDAAEAPGARSARRVAAAVAGVLAGFTTMVANAAGAIMTIYLLLSGIEMLTFLGTVAWFFFIVNLAKVPLSAALGLLGPASLGLDLTLVPMVVLGGLVGTRVIRRIKQRQFELWAMGLAGISAVLLLV